MRIARFLGSQCNQWYFHGVPGVCLREILCHTITKGLRGERPRGRTFDSPHLPAPLSQSRGAHGWANRAGREGRTCMRPTVPSKLDIVASAAICAPFARTSAADSDARSSASSEVAPSSCTRSAASSAPAWDRATCSSRTCGRGGQGRRGRLQYKSPSRKNL